MSRIESASSTQPTISWIYGFDTSSESNTYISHKVIDTSKEMLVITG